ncbi:MAG TPA: hypothetical protein VEB63_02695 [Chitinophagaceae bacterium]|nr:hypothetical protein [Chitinophagaceae bacterium]
MKPSIVLLLALLIFLSSCTTVYKSGQTPDDVYFSPARIHEVDSRSDRGNERINVVSDEYYDDHYLRMKVRNRYRWSELDDPFYYRRAYSFANYTCCYCKNPWTPYAYWNYYHNPYNNYVIINPKNTVYTAPRKVNLAAYNNPTLNTKTPVTAAGSPNRTYTNPRNSTRPVENSGNVLRDIFSAGKSSSGSGGSTGSSSGSSSSGSSGSSSSGSSSSGGNAPVRKF